MNRLENSYPMVLDHALSESDVYFLANMRHFLNMAFNDKTERKKF